MSAAPQWQPRFTLEQVQAFTDEELEQMSVVDQLEAKRIAYHFGDEERAAHIFSKLPLAPESLMAAKQTMGADWIKQRNLNTIRADEKYGPQWLDE